MRHLRLVPAAAAAPVEQPAADTGTGSTAALAPIPHPSARPIVAALDDDLPLLYVPARLVLALAGRCSCIECCTAYAEHRPEPHDPRRARDCEPRGHLRAI
ncbi:MAG: hypothetical protein ACJ74O_09675 [Frankiaceae bacterium]